MKGSNAFQLCLEKQNKVDFVFKTVHENEVLLSFSKLESVKEVREGKFTF